MTQAAKVQEPSMEEILASIRRIIADDDTGKATTELQQAAVPGAAVQPVPRPAAVAADAPLDQSAIDAVLADTGPHGGGADILDLTEAMAAPSSALPEPNFRTIDGEPDVVFSDRPPADMAQVGMTPAGMAEPVVRMADDLRRPAEPQPADRALMSPSTSAAVDSAFGSLANTILGQNARTLEDLVKEMLRPMLKSWLDDNLPSLVERIVRAEIERVSRGRM